MRAVEFPGEPVTFPHRLTHLHGSLAVTDAKYGLNLIRLPFAAACFQLTVQAIIGGAGGHENDRVNVHIEIPAIVPPGNLPRPGSREFVAEFVAITHRGRTPKHLERVR